MRSGKLIGLASWGLTLVVATAWSQAPASKAPPAHVVVANVQQKEVIADHSFVGQLVPSRRSIVGSAVDGRVVELLFNDGDRVGLVDAGDSVRRTGQPIVQLLTETISIEIAAARATEELRQQELNEMLAGTRSEELAQALARLEAAKALMDFTQAQYRRMKTLYEKGSSAAKEEYEEALANSVNAQQNHAAFQAAYEMAVKGPREEQIAQSRARLAAAQEERRRLEDQQRKYTIRAPFEGYAVAKLTEVGAWVSRGDPVAEIVALDPIEIDVTVPEAYIPHVKLGADVSVRIDALPQQTLTGKVARIVPQADLRSRSFPVKIQLDNPDTEGGGHLLKAGMLARVNMAVGPRQQALMVPKDALVLNQGSSAVMAVRHDEQSKKDFALPVSVQVGVAEGSMIQVIGGLRPDQQVIVVGNERVFPGQEILIQSSQ